MCGIIGYIGKEQAIPFLLDGLTKLEYRGYDSSGIALFDSSAKNTKIVKAKGPLQALREKIDKENQISANCGIGHTRWATHGEPSETNAHPHISYHDSVILVHNGIIENYQELKEELSSSGYQFYSQTDSEVAANLIDFYYQKTADPLDSISRTMFRLQGSYAFAIMFKNHPDKLFAARNQSPLIVGKDSSGCMIASDVPAILSHTKNVFYMDNQEIAEISHEDIHFYNMDKERITKELVQIHWHTEAAEKNGYEHFMLKEIFEQPQAIHDTLYAYMSDGEIDFSTSGLPNDLLASLKRIYIVACGSAYHAGLTAKYVLEQLAYIPVEVDVASEFRYRAPILENDSLVIIISQSGETADSLAALRLAKERNLPVLGIVNVKDSSIARESDHVMYTYAGPEISVATTKAYSTQLITLYLLAIQIAMTKGTLTKAMAGMLLLELELIPDKIARLLDKKDEFRTLSAHFSDVKDMFFIGRGIDHALSLEGSLKIKEISYIHSEAYAAGELKHGTISLIEPGIPVIGLLTQPDLYEKTMSNLMEVKSRGAFIAGFTTINETYQEQNMDYMIHLPPIDPLFATSLAIVPLQLLSYYVSTNRGHDVDKPRNLAKSVTVE